MLLDPATAACVSGLIAGGIHALVGPDHLAAVAPISMSYKRAPWMAGLSWGFGHALGTWVLAAIAFAGWRVLPLDDVSAVGERLVGVVLIGLGLWGLRALHRNRIHSHAHRHDGDPHVHIHVHDAAAVRTHAAPAHAFHTHAGWTIGLLHGLAGGGPFLAVLPAIALGDAASRLGYIGGYGVGAMLAMVLFAWMVGRLATRSRDNSAAAYRGLLAMGSTCAIAVGIFWLSPLVALFA